MATSLHEEVAVNQIPAAEQEAAPLRPVAHWVLFPDGERGDRLRMVWETPAPLPL